MTETAAASVRPTRDKRLTALLGAALLGGLALLGRGLIGYDPSASFEPYVSATENLLFSPTGASAALNVYVMLWLFFSRRRAIWRTLGQPAEPVAAALLLGSAFGLAYWSYYVSAPDLLVPAMACALFGAAFALGGRPAARAVGLPVFFLIFLVHRPGVLVNQIVYPLQMLTATTSYWLLQLLGREVVHMNDLLVTPDGTFQVVEGCSGLRLIETLFMAALLYVDLFRRNTLQAVTLIALSPLVAMLCNTLRVITIVLSPYSDLAAVHSTQGILVLVAGVLALAGVDSALREYVEPRVPRRLLGRIGRTALAQEPRALPVRRLGVVAGALWLFALGTLAVNPYAPRVTAQPLVSSLPARVGEWRVAEGLALDKEYMGSVAATTWTRRRYEREGEAVEIFIATNDHRRRLDSLRSPKTALLEPGVSLAGVTRVADDDAGAVYDRLELVRGNGRWQALYWDTAETSLVGESVRALLAFDQSPFRRAEREVVVRVATGARRGPLVASRRLASFLEDFAPALEALEIPIGYAPDPSDSRAGMEGS